MSEKRKVKINAFRFNAETDYLPYYKTYEMEVGKDELVLDLLNKIKWEHDGSFSYRRSCRHGICGACAIKVNGKAVLACKQNAMDLLDLFDDDITFEPQSKKRAIKDMIVDKADFWKKHFEVQPYLVAEVDKNPKKENIVLPEQVAKLLDADYCIQCGACHYSCPALEVNEDYLGPAALAAAYRFTADSRDEAGKERLETTFKTGTGVWDCVKCYECAQACPKEINPIDKITKLHQMTFKENMEEDNVATRHAVGFKWSIEKHGILDEGELVKYSEGLIGVLKHIPEAIAMYKKGKIVMPWNMPKSKNLDEIQKLVKSASTAKFKGK
jgi:succinate dehydrogenase / fumarate reductase iron-sulfur subunit